MWTIVSPCIEVVIPVEDGGGSRVIGRGLHSSTFQLNLSRS